MKKFLRNFANKAGQRGNNGRSTSKTRANHIKFDIGGTCPRPPWGVDLWGDECLMGKLAQDL